MLVCNKFFFIYVCIVWVWLSGRWDLKMCYNIVFEVWVFFEIKLYLCGNFEFGIFSLSSLFGSLVIGV